MYRSFVLVICLILLTGCSRTELLYRNADWLAYRWVDSMLEADQAQSEQWPLMFEQVMEEHRSELLPQVVALLDETSAQAARGMSVEGLACLWQDTGRLIGTHTRLIVPTATKVLGEVSESQVEHLAEVLKEDNEEYRDEFLSPDPDKREALRVSRFTKRIERWTGDLSPEQKRLIAAEVALMPDIADEWLSYRERQQQRLLELLREDVDPEVLEQFLVAWWVEQADRDQTLVEAYPPSRDGWIRMLVALDGTLERQQRDRLVERITDIRDDLASEIDGEFDMASLPQSAHSCRTVL